MALDDDELRALYERYAPVLHHRCARILGDREAAWDVVHETFARAIVHGDGFRVEAQPLTWLYRIATNLCLNQRRDGRNQRDKLEARAVGAPAGDAGHAAREAEAGVDHAALRALLDQVDPQTRQVVVHTYFDDCTRAEVAALVGISVPTVRKRLETFLRIAGRALGAAVLLIACWSLA